jgi:hypothetical protein
MTTAEVQQRLVRIAAEAKSRDYEAATVEERRLFVDLLTAVSEGLAGPEQCREALLSSGLHFPRFPF